MSPRTSSQLEKIRQQSRKKILDAALELFAMQGYHNTSISQIAKKAGVSKGLMYNYFDGKDDLMHQIVYERLSEGHDFVEQIGKQPDAKSKLRLLIDFSFNYLITDPHQSKLLAALSLQLDQFPDLMELIQGRYVGTLPLMEGLLIEIGIENPKEEAALIMALMDGLGMQYILLQGAMDLEHLKNYLIDKYCT